MNCVRTAIFWIGCVQLVGSTALGSTTSSTGGGQAFDNHQPALAMNYIVRTQGDFEDLGEIRLFGGNFAPRSWAFANGVLLPISSNTGLFSLLGTTYGGDGRTTFALPDLRGRTAVHEGNGPGISAHNLGQKFGQPNVQLNGANLPTHAHSLTSPNISTGNAGQFTNFSTAQPSLAVNYAITNVGQYPSRNGSGSGDTTGSGIGSAGRLLAEVSMFAGSQLPSSSWNFTDGQLIPIPNNDALFSLVGTIYGGDGRTTFGLPDLRARATMQPGNGPGLSSRVLGRKYGVEDVTLTQSNLVGHTHQLPPTANETGLTGNTSPSSFENMQPTLGLNYIIALQGVFPSRNGSGSGESDGATGSGGALDPFLGEIAMFAGNFAPRGWALLEGQILPINQNQSLYSLLGTTYGGDGRTSFALPDLRGRVPIGFGASPGLTSHMLGQKIGAERTTLTLTSLAAHTHSFTLLGDFNGDGLVNFADLSAAGTALTDPAQFAIDFPNVDRVAACDITHDGLCNFSDLSDLADLFNNLPGSSTGTSVPEPSAWLLLACAAATLATNGRKKAAGLLERLASGSINC